MGGIKGAKGRPLLTLSRVSRFTRSPWLRLYPTYRLSLSNGFSLSRGKKNHYTDMMSSNDRGCKLVMEVGSDLPFWSPDVLFEVRVRGADGDEDNAVTFHAHRFVLEAKAPKLAAQFGPFVNKVSITDVDPTVFHCLLRSAYGGGIGEEDFIAHGKSIIDTAHKYDMSDLKLKAEEAYVKSTKITTENAIDLLLYAEALNLDLLRGVVIDFFEKNKDFLLLQLGNGWPFPPMSSAAPKNSFNSTKKAAAPSPSSSPAFPPKSPFTKTAGGGGLSSTQTGFSFGAKAPAASSSGAP